MTSSTPSAGPLALIVDNEEWFSRSLKSVLSHEGYRVIIAHTASKGWETAKAQLPDVLFVSKRLPNGDGIDLCQTVRDDARLGPGLPIIVTADGPASRRDRLAALRAGAWEYLSFPIDPEELILKLRSFLQAKLELERVRERSLLDDVTGLYNLHGLEHRAQEIASAARREGQAVACIVVAPTLDSGPNSEAFSEIDGATSAAARCGDVLRMVVRGSDVIGRLGRLEFAVVTRGADRDGVLTLAGRIADALRSILEKEEFTSVDLHAGFDLIPNAQETPVVPRDLLVHATKALQDSRRLGNGDWIQPFRPG